MIKQRETSISNFIIFDFDFVVSGEGIYKKIMELYERSKIEILKEN
jgi:hypothetical protein